MLVFGGLLMPHVHPHSSLDNYECCIDKQPLVLFADQELKHYPMVTTTLTCYPSTEQMAPCAGSTTLEAAAQRGMKLHKRWPPGPNYPFCSLTCTLFQEVSLHAAYAASSERNAPPWE